MVCAGPHQYAENFKNKGINLFLEKIRGSMGNMYHSWHYSCTWEMIFIFFSSFVNTKISETD